MKCSVCQRDGIIEYGKCQGCHYKTYRDYTPNHVPCECGHYELSHGMFMHMNCSECECRQFMPVLSLTDFKKLGHKV